MSAVTFTASDFEALLQQAEQPVAAKMQINCEVLSLLCARLGHSIKLPCLDETEELQVLAQLVLTIDRLLAEYLPPQIYSMVQNQELGLDDVETARLSSRLLRLAHKRIQLPYLAEHEEYFAISFVINLIINAMREGSDLQHAIKVTDTPDMLADDFPFPQLN